VYLLYCTVGRAQCSLHIKRNLCSGNALFKSISGAETSRQEINEGMKEELQITSLLSVIKKYADNW
jgi:hypothetical protein